MQPEAAEGHESATGFWVLTTESEFTELKFTEL